MAQSLTGTLQMYLVLGALANNDVLGMKTFKLNSSVQAGRDIMYADDMDVEHNFADFETFRDRAKIALEASGFSKDFIDQINWPNFQLPGVWQALKTLSNSLPLLSEAYEGPECPCMSILVRTAVIMEHELEIVRGRKTS
jgi:hypothetical protein